MTYTVTVGDIIGAVALGCLAAFIASMFFRSMLEFERSWRIELQGKLEDANRTIKAVRSVLGREEKP